MNNSLGKILICSFSLFLLGNVCLGQSASRNSSPPALADNRSPTAAVAFADGKSLTLRGKAGQLPFVAMNAGETVAIQVQFPTALGGRAVVVQALDGGAIPKAQQDTLLTADGTTAIQFLVGQQSGLYRVLVACGDVSATLQFWVADPQNQSMNAAAVRP
jgi:hypothetical protein